MTRAVRAAIVVALLLAPVAVAAQTLPAVYTVQPIGSLSGSCPANQFVTALSSGAAPTCAQPSTSNLSDAANVPLLNANNTWSGAQTNVTAQPFAAVINNAVQSVNSGALTALTFNTETTNVGAMHSTGVNPTRITFLTAGLYVCSANATWPADTSTLRIMAWFINGAEYVEARTNSINAVGASSFSVPDLYYKAAVNDYVEVDVYQNSGGALNIGSATAYLSNRLACMKVW